METKKLYLDDPYLKNFEANVIYAKDNEIVLDRTAFYPEGGGQPYDTGKIMNENEFSVIEVRKENEYVVHKLDRNFTGSLNVKGEIDWDRRYAHMRHHTAIHIMSGVLYKKYNARITGSQIYTDRARMDINYDLKKEDLPVIEKEANNIVEMNLNVNIKYIKRSEMKQDLVRVREDLLPDVDIIRVIEIEGFDMQADGGTHVRKTGEVGRIVISKYENKGKNNKRIYLNLL